MTDPYTTYGYYDVLITLDGSGRLLRTNNERAFVVSQLQDLLSPRLVLSSVPVHAQLPFCIDLLAFSLRPTSIEVIVFCIDKALLGDFVTIVKNRLIEYRQEYGQSSQRSQPMLIAMKKLAGPHHALERSVDLHLRHEDWEYDRYSSIGFYLHDRRGDWMRTWRLSNLFESDSKRYRDYLLYSMTGVLEPITRL